MACVEPVESPGFGAEGGSQSQSHRQGVIFHENSRNIVNDTCYFPWKFFMNNVMQTGYFPWKKDGNNQGCSLGLEHLSLETVSRRFLTSRSRLDAVSQKSRSHLGLEPLTSWYRLGLGIIRLVYNPGNNWLAVTQTLNPERPMMPPDPKWPMKRSGAGAEIRCI